MDLFTYTSGNDGYRRGLIKTKHGNVSTPFFMPDATRASVRGLTTQQLSAMGVCPMVVNTYHLFLQPGVELIKGLGGVHAFMHWDGPLLSDSGGYQVFSLIHKNSQLGRITEEGAEFRSVLDGSKHLLTPERAIQIQFDLGVDMMVCLDDPRPNSAPDEEIEMAVERTLRWARRCKDEYNRQISLRGMDRDELRPLLFGVVQGGKSLDLRKRCVDGLVDISFDGYGFGARHVDEKGIFLEEVLSYTAAILPKESIRFALGVGTPSDVVKCYSYGWDIFDCVIPTREGRHGRLFVWNEGREGLTAKELVDNANSFYHIYTITNAQFRNDVRPIDASCDCFACQEHSLAYIHHLFRVGEPLGAQLAALHNVRFFMKLMQVLRMGVDEDASRNL